VHSAEEQVYIALVVVKRPATKGQPDLDPNRWAQQVMNGLAEPRAQHIGASGYAWRAERSRSPLPRAVYAGIGMLCLACAACICYLGAK
jgi:hypothetical protein